MRNKFRVRRFNFTKNNIIDYYCLRGGGTSKIRTSKGQNVESILKDDHNVERSECQKSERQEERRKSKNDFLRSDLF
jgi:hypothetical protein